MRLLLCLVAGALLAGCAHHLRHENVRHREEPAAEEEFIERERLIVALSETREMLTIQVEREVVVEQDVWVIREADEVHIPWSGYALIQFLFISWNPIVWSFPDTWHEAEGADHAAIRDWFLLWNPLIRTGGRFEEARRAVELDRQQEHRVLGAERLPINLTEVRLVLSAGVAHETLRRRTDERGRIRIAFDTLPAAMGDVRPLTVEASIEGRGAVAARLF